MTVEEIKFYVKQVEEEKDDPEIAHAIEDYLYLHFVHYVAQVSTGDLREKAKLVLQTQNVEFPRWT